MSGGQNQKPCKKYPPKKVIDAKKATIVRMRKYAKEIDEPREITAAKIKAIRDQDLSIGNIVRLDTELCTYFFAIR